MVALKKTVTYVKSHRKIENPRDIAGKQTNKQTKKLSDTAHHIDLPNRQTAHHINLPNRQTQHITSIYPTVRQHITSIYPTVRHSTSHRSTQPSDTAHHINLPNRQTQHITSIYPTVRQHITSIYPTVRHSTSHQSTFSSSMRGCTAQRLSGSRVFSPSSFSRGSTCCSMISFTRRWISCTRGDNPSTLTGI